MRKIKAILLILGILTLAFAVASVFLVNFNFGIIIIFGISCVLISYGLFFEKLVKLKWVTYSILAVFVLFLTMILFIGFYGGADNATFDEDVAIVLGAGVRGEQVSQMLAYRLDKAAEYSAKNPKAVIVVSGGQGPQEDITEALAMERYLLDKGVAKERIIKEEDATSTYENFLYSKKILDEMFDRPYNTVIITNGFHIFRAVKLAKILELDVTHYHAKIEWYSVTISYSRECLATLKMWLLGK